MSKFANHKNIVATLIGCIASTTLAQPPRNTPHPRLATTKTAITKPAKDNMSFDLAVGAGTYPVLELPMRRFSESRVDGSITQEDIRVTKGALIDLKLEWNTSPNKTPDSIPFSFAIATQRMSSAPTIGISTPSTYFRINADARAHYSLENLGLTLIPGVEARRSMFRNLESGHYVDSVLIKSSIETLSYNNAVFSINAGYAPLTRFGLTQPGASQKSGVLAGSKANMSEFGTRITWSPDSESSFYAGYSQENILASLSSTDGYSTYGLPMTEPEFGSSQKTYDLTVRQIVLGTSKRF